MGLTPSDEYIVKDKIELTNATIVMSHFITIWKGKTMSISFNNISNSIHSIYCDSVLEPGDIGLLENIIIEHVGFNG